MRSSYIERILRIEDGQGNARTLTESDLAGLSAPFILLGDPGLGKTKLTESLETRLKGKRLLGGTFVRTANADSLLGRDRRILIIDGLDEITTRTGGGAVDEVLEKLSSLGRPNFVLSCRAADWQGSTARHKIESDYGTAPTILHLLPFSYDNAKQFLAEYIEEIRAEEVLDELSKRNLDGFYGNPLTLRLIAELVVGRQRLPETRAGLFDQACRLLVREENAAHQRSVSALADLNDLLDSAGAIYAHLLLSGSIGIADRRREDTPSGYVSKMSLGGLPKAPLCDAALRTRLFQSAGENLFVPIHRVVAEFLGARWISDSLGAGLSERRVFQCLTIANSVPTPLRGLHAWLAYFSPRIASRCILSDPYGVLRYGETSRLSTDLAQLLLRSLQTMADEDPYFRSEDWGAQAIAGLARPELKEEIIALITRPKRHFHLSMLMLEALHGSNLTDAILPELLGIVKDPAAAYAERSSAVTAILHRNLDVDWVSIILELRGRRGRQEDRLALELIASTDGAGLTAEQIADTIIEYLQVFSENRERESYVSGVDRKLVPKLSGELCAEILDVFVLRLEASGKPRHWRAGLEFSSLLYAMIAKVTSGERSPNARRLWSWLKQLEDERSYHREDKKSIAAYLEENRALRREVQRVAIRDTSAGEDPWMTIVHTLPVTSSALDLTAQDTIEFLRDIADKSELTKQDVDEWFALVRYKQFGSGFNDEIKRVAQLGLDRHPALKKVWDEFLSSPVPDWKKEQEQRERRYREKQLLRFKAHRAIFAPHIEAIRSGKDLGALANLAAAYLGRSTDFDRDAMPADKLREWLGEELAEAALAGFVAVLTRDDLPTARQVSELHADDREYNFEAAVKCGIAEMIRNGQSLHTIRRDILLVGLVAWWRFPELDADRAGIDIGEYLERLLLVSDKDKAEFLEIVIEPQLLAGLERVNALYRMGHNEIFRDVAGELALRWLRHYPSTGPYVHGELLEIAIRYGSKEELRTLTRERLPLIDSRGDEIKGMWISAAFAADFESSHSDVAAFAQTHPSTIWHFRNVIRPERGQAWKAVTVEQLSFVVDMYAAAWPPASFPSGGWSGGANPWDASEFILSCINGIGAESSEVATDLLGYLIAKPSTASYAEHLKHARAQQRQLRWDREFAVPTFEQIKSVFTSSVPVRVDDLRALLVDCLEDFQIYVQHGDTRGWEAFWALDKPKNENTCRDRLLDLLRPRIRSEIALMPETTMPDVKRVDINAILGQIGVPVEIKGQWHPSMWDAASVQLDESYTRDWRADGRGIYLVLWFGVIEGKNLQAHPDGVELPSTPSDLRTMLVDRLSESQRSRIDVVVLDLSRSSIKPKQ